MFSFSRGPFPTQGDVSAPAAVVGDRVVVPSSGAGPERTPGAAPAVALRRSERRRVAAGAAQPGVAAVIPTLTAARRGRRLAAAAAAVSESAVEAAAEAEVAVPPALSAMEQLAAKVNRGCSLLISRHQRALLRLLQSLRSAAHPFCAVSRALSAAHRPDTTLFVTSVPDEEVARAMEVCFEPVLGGGLLSLCFHL